MASQRFISRVENGLNVRSFVKSSISLNSPSLRCASAFTVDRYFILEGRFQFTFEVRYKICNPPVILIVFLTVADENVVIEFRDQGGHYLKITNCGRCYLSACFKIAPAFNILVAETAD